MILYRLIATSEYNHLHSLYRSCTMKYPMDLTCSQKHTLFTSRVGSSHYEQSMVDTLSSSSHCTHTIFKPVFMQLFLISTQGTCALAQFYLKHTLRRSVLYGAVLGSYQTFTLLQDSALFDKGILKKP